MKKILMIATGGTIACIPSDNGLIPSLSGKEIIELVPALQHICTIDIIKIMNIDSSNLSPHNWISMLDTVEKNYNDYDGFVITHGTDTMAYLQSLIFFSFIILQLMLYFICFKFVFFIRNII